MASRLSKHPRKPQKIFGSRTQPLRASNASSAVWPRASGRPPELQHPHLYNGLAMRHVSEAGHAGEGSALDQAKLREQSPARSVQAALSSSCHQLLAPAFLPDLEILPSCLLAFAHSGPPVRSGLSLSSPQPFQSGSPPTLCMEPSGRILDVPLSFLQEEKKKVRLLDGLFRPTQVCVCV